MSKVVTTTVLPRDGFDTLNIGATGDTVAIAGDSLNTNVLQDAGGNNIFTSSSGTVSSTPLQGSLQLLSSQTASGATSVGFTSGIDSTYDVYIIKYFLHLNTGNAALYLGGSTDGGSSYGVTKTTTFFRAKHNESDSEASLDYQTGYDRAQSTSFQWLSLGANNDADGHLAGELYIFAPSSTTYVKHFYGRTSEMGHADPSPYAYDSWYDGYWNTTTAINAIQFSQTAGTMTGTIKLYGISKT